ncbi:MAG TPA: alcohol dehydrogenase catalytic domain-containing protein [Candidatus Limnocylindrales bacterium]|nr:alcohol dehydrogenase catalytic domain-containing protein [Candidatus Limnocylindrales bacterium]
MRALALTAFGGPEHLSFVELPDPTPATDEVLVRVRTVGANRMDLDVMRHKGIGMRVSLPQILGLDPAGEVVATGAAVTDLRPGDRVVAKPSVACGACRFCLAGDDDACAHLVNLGVDRQGGFAELIAIPRQNLARIPGGLDFPAATALAHAAPVALLMLRERAAVRPGEVVLVSGAGGSIGSAAVQIACLLGCRVIALAGSPATVEWASSLGAEAVVDTSAEPTFAAHVRELAGPDGVAVHVESVGDPGVFAEAVRSLGRRARAVVCGSHAAPEVSIDLNWLYRNRISLIGSSGSSLASFRDAFALVAEGRIRPNIHAVLPLERAADAYRLLLERRNRGKVVLQVS